MNRAGAGARGLARRRGAAHGQAGRPHSGEADPDGLEVRLGVWDYGVSGSDPPDGWWAVEDSNLRPSGCKPDALAI